MIYDYTIYPIECIYKVIYLCFYSLANSYGLALIFLSIFTSCITHPLMKWASNISKDEKEVQKYLTPQIEKIKARLSGAEQHHAIQRLYKRYGYHPVMAVRTAIGVMLQLPFLMAAYYMLSNLEAIKDVSWLFVKDLGQPDMLIAGFNIMPFVMTAVNLLSAYTTVGFTKKDKLQAFVIAGMFLVLLYHAPSALLIYWTFNNLWTLLENLINKYQLKIPSIKIKGKGIIYWINNLPEHIYVLLTLAFTCALFIPMDIYLSNINEFWFGLSKIFPWFLLWSLVASFIFLVLYTVLRDEYRVVFITLTVGALIGIVVQSYLINLNYGVLNGVAIDWKKYKIEGIINTLIWLVCFTIPILCCLKLKYKKFLQITVKFCVVLVVVQVASLFYVHIKHPEEKKFNCVLTTDKMFEISSKDNIIVFVLDRFDNEIFDKILEKDSWVKEKLAGFTYYPDATSVYGGTDLALPHILTGIKYKNDMLVKDYVDKAWKNTTFYDEMIKNDYDVGVYTFKHFVTPSSKVLLNLKSEDTKKLSTSLSKKFMKLALFREVPHILKKKFVVYSGDFHSTGVKGGYNQNDIVFNKELMRGIKVNDDKNAFRLYHLNGPHPPYNMNRNIQKGASNEYEQGVGSLKIVFNYIEQMKKLGVFERSTIAIIADHGLWNSIGHGPLVLFKECNSTFDDFSTSSNQVSLIQLHTAILKRFTHKDKVIKDFGSYSMNERYVYYPKNTDSFYEFLVSGDMKNKDSWQVFRELHYMGNKNKFYIIGKDIFFGQDGTGFNYIEEGWGGRSVNGIPTQKDTIAKLTVCSPYFVNRDLILYCDISAWEVKDYGSTFIDVFVNGQKVGSWKTKKERKYSIRIPKNLIGSMETVNIGFKINNSERIWLMKLKIQEE